MLSKVERVEQFAQQGLERCWTLHALNLQKAIRLLCSCVAQVFDIQAEHYLTLADCQERWLESLEAQTRQVAIGLCRSHGLIGITQKQHEEIDYELRSALIAPFERWRSTLSRTSADAIKSEIESGKRARTPGTINSVLAAKRMQAFLDANGISQVMFAKQAKTTDRTIRSFLSSGKVRKDIFLDIARAMGKKPEDLLKAEPEGGK